MVVVVVAIVVAAAAMMMVVVPAFSPRVVVTVISGDPAVVAFEIGHV